jgi:predicted oxidoreductase (fatty acid repression mutant protein)
MDNRIVVLEMLNRLDVNENIKSSIREKLDVLGEDQIARIVIALEKADKRLKKIAVGQSRQVVEEITLERRSKKSDGQKKNRDLEEIEKVEEQDVLEALLSELDHISDN